MNPTKRMKRKSITNPDELNRNLQYSSPITWIALGSVILLILGFFIWSFIYKVELKIEGIASITSGEATLYVDSSSLNKLKVDQKVYISGIEGKILSFDEDKQPIVSTFPLNDGEYPYYIEVFMKPVDFLINN